jgi:hypothetical protein
MHPPSVLAISNPKTLKLQNPVGMPATFFPLLFVTVVSVYQRDGSQLELICAGLDGRLQIQAIRPHHPF